MRSRNRYTGILVVLAIAVAVVTAVAILRLPTAGSIRYSASDPRGALAQLRGSLQAVGIPQATGTIQHLVRSDQRPLSFRAQTYWLSADVSSRRDDYLAAGSLVVLTLLVSAFALERRPVAEPAAKRAEARTPARARTTVKVAE